MHFLNYMDISQLRSILKIENTLQGSNNTADEWENASVRAKIDYFKSYRNTQRIKHKLKEKKKYEKFGATCKVWVASILKGSENARDRKYV